MSSLLLSFGPSWVQLGLVLAHFLWQGTAIALLLAGALFLLRRRSPGTRYAACGLAMLLMAASPVATVCYVRAHPLPTALAVARFSSELPSALGRTDGPLPEVPGSRETVIPIAAAPQFKAASPLRSSAERDDVRIGWLGTGVDETAASPVRNEATRAERLVERRTVATDTEYSSGWYGLSLQLAAVGWALGVVAMSLRLLAGWLGLRRLYLGQSEPLPDGVANVVCRLCRHLELGDRTEVLATRAWREPVAFGLLKPVVLLPLSMLTQYPTEVLEAMIAHELAHVRRYDLWVNVFQRVIEAVLFYHPAVWWVSGRMRLERELCCDDLAIQVTGRRAEYASALVELCRTWQGSVTPALAAGMFGPRLTMMTRVRRVLRMPATRDESSRSGFLLAGPLSVVLAGTFILAASLRSTQPGGASAASPGTKSPGATTSVDAVSGAPTSPVSAQAPRAVATTRPSMIAGRSAVRHVASRPAHPSDSHAYSFDWECVPVTEALDQFRQQAGLSMPNLARIVAAAGAEGEALTFRSVRPMSFDEALLMVNHLIEDHDMWIVRQDQFLDIRQLQDWQQHIPASNRFGSETAFREARLPQWDVASVTYRCRADYLESLVERIAEVVPGGAAVARAYPETGRIELAGVVQYVEQMLEALKQHEGDGEPTGLVVPTTDAPAAISRLLTATGSANAPGIPRPAAARSGRSPAVVATGALETPSLVVDATRSTGEVAVQRPLLTIRSQADGVVAEVLVKDGQKIHAGDLVARLDAEEIKLELAAAEVRCSSAEPLAKSAAARFSKGVGPEDEVRKAESALQLAAIDLKRCQLRLQRTEIRSPWDGEICGDRYSRTQGATSLLALVGKRVVAGDPVVEILVAVPRDNKTGQGAETRPAATPPSGREKPADVPKMPGGRAASPTQLTEPAGR